MQGNKPCYPFYIWSWRINHHLCRFHLCLFQPPGVRIEFVIQHRQLPMSVWRWRVRLKLCTYFPPTNMCTDCAWCWISICAFCYFVNPMIKCIWLSPTYSMCFDPVCIKGFLFLKTMVIWPNCKCLLITDTAYSHSNLASEMQLPLI